MTNIQNIQMDRAGIDQALVRDGLRAGVRKYGWLQTQLHARDVSRDREYRKSFNGFYRVRRGTDWQDVFYDILERSKSKRPLLADVLVELHAATRRVEASFASKLVATVDPSNPVVDSIVLRSLGLRLPSSGPVALRIEGIVALRDRMARAFSEFLDTAQGRYLVARFRVVYPEAQLTEVKMLDLVLWQTRSAASACSRRRLVE